MLNIMPQAEKYEPSVRRLIENRPSAVETVLIRSALHAYKSSDKKHLAQFYVTFDRAVDGKKLDGLIITGAPVGAIDFENITYWNELKSIFDYARTGIAGTLGICWGAIAVGKYLGADRTMLADKLFGVFPARWLVKKHWSCGGSKSPFNCPQSRYASLDERDLARLKKEGALRLLAGSGAAGHFIFESADGRFAGHMGHPEYDTDRIMFEYRRDQLKGLNLVPAHFEVGRPRDTWSGASLGFFGRWLKMLEAKKAA